MEIKTCALTREIETLANDLSREIERCQELLVAYEQIGPVDAFGAAIIRADIKTAQQAMMEQDLAAMLAAYQALKDAD